MKKTHIIGIIMIAVAIGSLIGLLGSSTTGSSVRYCARTRCLIFLGTFGCANARSYGVAGA